MQRVVSMAPERKGSPLDPADRLDMFYHGINHVFGCSSPLGPDAGETTKDRPLSPSTEAARVEHLLDLRVERAAPENRESSDPDEPAASETHDYVDEHEREGEDDER